MHTMQIATVRNVTLLSFSYHIVENESALTLIIHCLQWLIVNLTNYCYKALCHFDNLFKQENILYY